MSVDENGSFVITFILHMSAIYGYHQGGSVTAEKIGEVGNKQSASDVLSILNGAFDKGELL